MSVDSNSQVDPRVQIELEKLNTATDNINKYEVELDEAKCEFKRMLTESVDRIKHSSHKLTNSIQTAKPYYEARLYSTQLSKEAQLAAVNFEKAKSVHAAAKEMVYLAELGLGEKSTLDTACQEMLSHAASRVNQSQIDCTETRNVLKICELKQEVANNRVSKLQSQLKSAIRASSFNIRRNLLLLNLIVYQSDLLFLPYYETRANYNGLLKNQKKRINDLESRVSDAKMTYNEALKNLEQISEEIHKMREERRREYGEFNERDAVHYSASSSQINSTDEYLDFPTKLSIKASPVRQQKLESLDCPHLLKDFNSFPKQCSSNDNSDAQTDITNLSSDDIEQWTEIRLSGSESTSSGYSQHNSPTVDDRTPPGSDSSSSEDATKKVKCSVIHQQNDNEKKDGLSNWIGKSNVKEAPRRQSLDLLIDAGDKVKDVFVGGFQKVGRSLERRSSESEVNQTESNDFFLFSRSDNKEALSDEQVENLLLNEDCTEMLHISK